jgi:hypothetical protein
MPNRVSICRIETGQTQDWLATEEMTGRSYGSAQTLLPAWQEFSNDPVFCDCIEQSWIARRRCTITATRVRGS